MPSDDFNKMLKISERLNNQFKPIFKIDKQLASIKEIPRPAMKTINIVNELKISQPLTQTRMYDSLAIKNFTSTVSDLLSTYTMQNIDNNFRNAFQPFCIAISELLQNVDISAITKSMLVFSSAISSLTTPVDIENDVYEESLDTVLEDAYSDPSIKKLGKYIINNAKSKVSEYSDTFFEAIEVINNKFEASKTSKACKKLLILILRIIFECIICNFVNNLLEKPIPPTINYTINNYYNIDECNELLSDIETIKELNIHTLAVINKDAKIYRSNSLKSGVCSKLQNGQLVHIVHKNKKWCNIKWIANGEEHYGWVQNYHLNSLIIDN